MNIFAILQYIGAALVLVGFAGNAQGWMDSTSPSYLLINLVGAGCLVASAAKGKQWGFFILNVVWSVVALVGLARLL